jgi:hypothetical protein
VVNLSISMRLFLHNNFFFFFGCGYFGDGAPKLFA